MMRCYDVSKLRHDFSVRDLLALRAIIAVRISREVNSRGVSRVTVMAIVLLKHI